jgi:hypothetical protein
MPYTPAGGRIDIITGAPFGPSSNSPEVVNASDPKTWTRPWSAAFPLRRDPDYKIFEYVCHEGNNAMSNILSASRSEDRQAAEKAATER